MSIGAHTLKRIVGIGRRTLLIYILKSRELYNVQLLICEVAFLATEIVNESHYSAVRPRRGVFYTSK